MVASHTANMMKRTPKDIGGDPYNKNKEMDSKYQKTFGAIPDFYEKLL